MRVIATKSRLWRDCRGGCLGRALRGGLLVGFLTGCVVLRHQACLATEKQNDRCGYDFKCGKFHIVLRQVCNTSNSSKVRLQGIVRWSVVLTFCINVEVLLTVGAGTITIAFPVVGLVEEQRIDGIIGTGVDGRIEASVAAGEIVVCPQQELKEM